MSQLRLRRRTVLAAATILAALAGPATLARPASAGVNSLTDLMPTARYPAFYIPPSPLPAKPAGTLIRAERFNSKLAITKLRNGVQAWRIMYLSTSAVGNPIAVTGTVLVPGPEQPALGVDKRPIISYGNEAIGLGDNCADSRLLKYGHSGEITLYDPLLRRGYAVAATDYEGLGTPDVHTFGVTVSAAHTMLDIVRAARQLTDAHLPQNGVVGLFGYSQGGAAVAGAAELAPYYAPDVKVTASALGGAPTNPVAFSKFNDGGFFAAGNFAAAAGYDAAYPELNVRASLNAKGNAILDDTYNGCIEAIFSDAFTKLSSVVTHDIYSDPAWQARFEQNHAGHIAPRTPTYVFHAYLDEGVPFSTATELRRAWCAGHTPLRFVPLVGFEHVAAGPLWMPQAARWLAAELEGRQHDQGNCGSFPPRVEPAPPADGGV